MGKRAAFTIVVCALISLFGASVFAQNSVLVKTDTTAKKKTSISVKHRKKKKKKIVKTKSTQTSTPTIKSTPAPKKTISIVPPSQLKPTMTGNPGTVKYYFFPDRKGAEWTLRTIQLLIDKDNKIVRADTLFAQSRVIDTAKFSLQGLPLMVTSDTSYKSTGYGARTESSYYVDDSIAMTVMNNSISNGENRIFMVSPVKLRNAWHEKYEDTVVTMIAGFGDSVITSLGRFDHVMVTLTQPDDYSDMRKYYAPGHGIIKTVFRSIGPGGKGLVIVTTEMIAFKKPD